MDEDTFWRSTFRKLDALLTVHNQVNGAEDQKQEEPLTITELLSWG